MGDIEIHPLFYHLIFHHFLPLKTIHPVESTPQLSPSFTRFNVTGDQGPVPDNARMA